MDGHSGTQATAGAQVREVDAVVVGAGFAGLYMLYRLREAGWSAQGYEAGSGVGGTWYWNRYPGARCDVESLEYSYGFDEALQQEWEWSERYAGQPEILRYLEHVADRFDLRPMIQFDTRVATAHYDDAANRWSVTTDAGAAVSARFLIMATGCLSSANMPDIPGRDDFAGEILHTGRWPHEGVDFTGKRVAVIGTGSSAIQSIPIIAEQADGLTVFQRTAAYSVPARNAPLDPEEQREIKARYADFRARNKLQMTAFGSRSPAPEKSALEADEEEIAKEYEARWERGGFQYLAAYNDLLFSREANETAAQFVRDKIREIVEDPDVAERLVPSQVIGCKRLCLDTNYFDTYNRPNVELVDISTAPIEQITPTGLRTNGVDYEFDSLVFATGFDAMTGALLSIDIKGRDGTTLKEAWHAGPITYLGLGVPQFPNMFVITGPGSPSVLTNMVVSIEHHVSWISDCLDHLRANEHTTIEATPTAAEQWVGYVNSVADLTLYPHCNSWYLGANIPGKTRVFMPLPGFPPYAEQCATVAANGYDGFALT
jgi:cyclohexanone monooxygenase